MSAHTLFDACDEYRFSTLVPPGHLEEPGCHNCIWAIESSTACERFSTRWRALVDGYFSSEHKEE